MQYDLFSKASFRKLIILFTITGLFVSGNFLGISAMPRSAYADEMVIDTVRLSGTTRYLTAIEISKNNWDQAYNVVLARGDDFPDALAGAVLASSPAVNGPLLLTQSNVLRADVLQEIKRLHASTVYILGGLGAVSAGVEQGLKENGLEVVRIQGRDRYDTAAHISTKAVSSSSKAFFASGENFADALSISSYAAAQGIPLLLTKKGGVSDATSAALQNLGVTDVTLIGGENALGQSIESQLRESGYKVDRISGVDRFQTNIEILNHFRFNLDQVIIATGMSFPDALSGSVFAAKNGNPVLLVPKDDCKIPSSATASYLEQNRQNVRRFSILGGSSAVNYKTEFFIRNGKFNPRISLQFWDGYGNQNTYERVLSYVPGNLNDSIQILVPNFAGELQANGGFAYSFPNASIPKSLVSLGQNNGAKVVPMVLASGETANNMLLDPAKRNTFADSAVRLVQETQADGILVDLEDLADHTREGLTSLMQDIYSRFNAQGKLVIVSVMSKTSGTAEPWYREYHYQALGQNADYVQIMSYDFSYASSAPGPIAPLDWVRKVMAYAVTQIPSEKILMGVPYYGRAWKKSEDKWVSQSFGYAKATSIASQFGAVVTRETTPSDPVGIPTFRYTDERGDRWTAYFDDRKSWEAKLDVAEQYDLGGFSGWAMGWINEVSSSELYPLLKDRS